MFVCACARAKYPKNIKNAHLALNVSQLLKEQNLSITHFTEKQETTRTLTKALEVFLSYVHFGTSQNAGSEPKRVDNFFRKEPTRFVVCDKCTRDRHHFHNM